MPPPTTSTSLSTALYCTTMSRGLRGANEALAFLLEVVALVAVGVWGYHVGSGVPLKVVLAIVLPLLVAVVWGLFAAPRAVVTLPLWGVLVVKALVFGAATAALILSGHRVLGVVFAVVVIANTATLTVGRTREPA
jgi:hypothetical protein